MSPQTIQRAVTAALLASLILVYLGAEATDADMESAEKIPQPVNASSATCDFGQTAYGAMCEHPSGFQGSLAGDTYGAHGQHTGGNQGFLGHINYGVLGQHPGGYTGTLASNGFGVYGQSSGASTQGSLGGDTYGVYGLYATTGNSGLLGSSDVGVYGWHNASANYGSIGGSFYGARGWNANNNRGYLGHDSYGVWGFGSPWAGYFDGNVHVTGALTGGSAAFKVDHPLDPANQYLVHSAVESPDMMNVYNGNVTTDAEGFATVTLPSYFEALNRDFRYQLTVIGQFAQAIVAEKIQGNRFVVRTDQPNVEVSWLVTGIRKDPWAEANRIVVEEAKPAVEQGYYLHPALYGQPAERSVEWARDPEGMREIQEMPARMEEEQQRM